MKSLKLSLFDMLLVREGFSSCDVTDLVAESSGNVADHEFDLVVDNQVITLQRNLFIFISPLLRNIFRTMLPCIRPMIVLPSDITVGAVKILQEIIENFGDFDYDKPLIVEELQHFDTLLDILSIKPKYFKILPKDFSPDEIQNDSDDEDFYEVSLEDIEKVPDIEDSDWNEDKSYQTNDKEQLQVTLSNSLFDQLDSLLGEDDPDIVTNDKTTKLDLSSQNKDLELSKEGDLLPCQFCDKELCPAPLIEHLKVHIQSVNTKDLVLSCPYYDCDRIFHYISSYGVVVGKTKQLLHLEDHLRARHTKLPSLVCDLCCKVFFSKMAFQYHQRQHNDKSKYYCDICEHFINIHMKESHSRKCRKLQEKSFECKACMKMFKTKGNMKIHALTHSKEKPFKCDGCPKAFSQKGNLKTHQYKKHQLKLKHKIVSEL